MPCKLCGLPTPQPPLRDGEHEFCCFACREVYRHFGAGIFAARQDASRSTAATRPGLDAYLWIEGMHCASCEILTEKIALDTPGILAASTSYATSTARITYDPQQIQESALPSLLSRYGYRARLRSEGAPEYDESQDLLRLVSGGGLAAAVMMLSLLFIYPIHAGFAVHADYEAIQWLAFKMAPLALLVFTSILVFYVALPILRGAWTGIRVGMLNMDCLLALSFLSAYSYSVVQLFYDPIDLYFEVAGTLIAVITAGRFFERRVRLRATETLNAIMEAWSPTARVCRDGEYTVCNIDELQPGDRVAVQQGETIPVDGVVRSGQGAVSEALMTGEPLPITRSIGEKVIGGSALLEGDLEIEIGAQVESRMADLAHILWNTQSSRTGMQARIDRLSRVFVPIVLVLAALVGLFFHLSGAPMEKALLASLATLIVSCPCTFGLAIPLTTATAIGAGLHNGIIVTSADLFEKAPDFDVIAIDKTGTLSTGDMSVVTVIGSPAVGAYAAAVEQHSSHPVAKAIAQLDASPATASDIEIHPGRGVLGTLDGRRVAVGSRVLFATLGWTIPEALATQVSQGLHGEGVVSYVGWDNRVEGAIVTRDRARPNWEQVAKRLRRHGRLVLLTGAERPSGYQAHVDEVHAGVPPEAKAAIIRQLKTAGTVAMIGDGSNDAPALAEADLGIAFGAPTALAAEAADIVIPGKQLERVLYAIDYIRVTRTRIRQSLGWSLAYNGVAIPLAMMGYLTPLVAALLMSASSILVVINATRAMPGIDGGDGGEGEDQPVPANLTSIGSTA